MNAESVKRSGPYLYWRGLTLGERAMHGDAQAVFVCNIPQDMRGGRKGDTVAERSNLRARVMMDVNCLAPISPNQVKRN